MLVGSTINCQLQSAALAAVKPCLWHVWRNSELLSKSFMTCSSVPTIIGGVNVPLCTWMHMVCYPFCRQWTDVAVSLSSFAFPSLQVSLHLLTFLRIIAGDFTMLLACYGWATAYLMNSECSPASVPWIVACYLPAATVLESGSSWDITALVLVAKQLSCDWLLSTTVDQAV